MKDSRLGVFCGSYEAADMNSSQDICFINLGGGGGGSNLI